MKRLLSVLSVLLAVLCFTGTALAQEPVYSSTRAFTALLREAEVAYEAEGVDEAGDDCIAVAQNGCNIYCLFAEDGQSAGIYVWYIIEYDQADEDAVIRVCDELNESSGGPCFYADSSDCSVTAVLDLTFPWDEAGTVAWRGFRAMAGALADAQSALARYNKVQTPAVTPAPTVAPTAAAVAAPSATPAPAAEPEETTVVITAQTARVRSGPGVTSPYLCTVRQGEVFPCLGVSGDWYIIDCGGRTGFVSVTVSRQQAAE